MDRSWVARWLARAARRARRLHAVRISPQQRAHLAALLIAFAVPLQGGDIDFNPQITEQEFRTFSRHVAQAIYPSPMQPAGASGLLRFSVGIAAAGVQVDTNASYWRRSVPEDITVGDYVAVPRLVVSKGLSAATISVSYAQVQDTDAQIIGGTLDLPIIDGGLIKPTLALRASYSTLRGVDVYRLNTYGLELFLGKGFGPVTPYAGVGQQRSDARGTIPTTAITLRDESTFTRYTAGVQLNLLLLRLAVEANQAEARSYGAKVSFGF